MQQIAVILPAGKLFDRIFTEAIAPLATQETQLSRISTHLTEPQLTATLQHLANSTSVIADLSARNPNVLFLTGYARALNKPITYITQHAEDFPFSAEPIVYASDLNFLRNELLSSVSGQAGQTLSAPTKDTAREKFLSIFGDLLQKHGYEHRGPIEQNEPTVFTLVDQSMDLPLVQEIARRGRELNLRVRLM
jgi:hypothetical protein